MLTCLESIQQVIKKTVCQLKLRGTVQCQNFLDEVGRVFMFVKRVNFHQSASRLPMRRVPPKVWVGPTCLQVTRHAPQTPPPPLQDLFSVSSAVETGADNSVELLRKSGGRRSYHHMNRHILQTKEGLRNCLLKKNPS